MTAKLNNLLRPAGIALLAMTATIGGLGLYGEFATATTWQGGLQPAFTMLYMTLIFLYAISGELFGQTKLLQSFPKYFCIGGTLASWAFIGYAFYLYLNNDLTTFTLIYGIGH